MIEREFQLKRRLGEGSHGEVWFAEEVFTRGWSRPVAIKLIKPGIPEEFVRRAFDEAWILTHLLHENIIQVEGLIYHEGRWGILMEYLPGMDLLRTLKFLDHQNKPMPWRVSFDITRATARALHAAYCEVPTGGGTSGVPLKVVHRDIKPANLFLTESGGLKVLDFGTAHASFALREVRTAMGVSHGTLGYMAPERFDGIDTPNAAGDVFSLGVVLLELLTHDPPRRPYRPGPIAWNKLKDALSSETKIKGWMGGALDDCLHLMLDERPEARPSAKEVEEMMELLAEKLANEDDLKRFSDVWIRLACKNVGEHQDVRASTEMTQWDMNVSLPLAAHTQIDNIQAHALELPEPIEILQGVEPSNSELLPPFFHGSSIISAQAVQGLVASLLVMVILTFVMVLVLVVFI